MRGATGVPPVKKAAGLIGTMVKNVVVLGLLVGSYFAVDTGYFSSDRTQRRHWNDLESLKQGKAKVTKAYEADFAKVKVDPLAGTSEGYWDFYNGATADTVKIEDGALVLNYTSAWIGANFRHTGFVPYGIYRVTMDAKVENEPAAILMRNRQLDLMREQIPVSDGAFKTYTFYYVAPAGSRDRVSVIFMPDNRGQPKGRMTVRKFLIERLEK
jgi:hypothetical protein